MFGLTLPYRRIVIRREKRPNLVKVFNDEVEECANAWGSAEVPVRQQVERRRHFRPEVKHSHQIRLVVADDSGHCREARSGLDRRKQCRDAIRSRCDMRFRRH